MNHVNFLKFLRENNACTPAIAWVKRNKFTSAQAWKKCNRLSWMTWLVRRAGDPSSFLYLSYWANTLPCDSLRKHVKHSQLWLLQ